MLGSGGTVGVGVVGTGVGAWVGSGVGSGSGSSVGSGVGAGPIDTTTFTLVFSRTVVPGSLLWEIIRPASTLSL